MENKEEEMQIKANKSGAHLFGTPSDVSDALANVFACILSRIGPGEGSALIDKSLQKALNIGSKPHIVIDKEDLDVIKSKLEEEQA